MEMDTAARVSLQPTTPECRKSMELATHNHEPHYSRQRVCQGFSLTVHSYVVSLLWFSWLECIKCSVLRSRLGAGCLEQMSTVVNGKSPRHGHKYPQHCIKLHLSYSQHPYWDFSQIYEKQMPKSTYVTEHTHRAERMNPWRCKWRTFKSRPLTLSGLSQTIVPPCATSSQSFLLSVQWFFKKLWLLICPVGKCHLYLRYIYAYIDMHTYICTRVLIYIHMYTHINKISSL